MKARYVVVDRSEHGTAGGVCCAPSDQPERGELRGVTCRHRRFRGACHSKEDLIVPAAGDVRCPKRMVLGPRGGVGPDLGCWPRLPGRTWRSSTATTSGPGTTSASALIIALRDVGLRVVVA